MTERICVIKARKLKKNYSATAAKPAVDNIDFDVFAGECFGMLGSNGAGKTSTMRMIGCVSPISSGLLQVLDLDAKTQGRKIKSRLGVVPQMDNLDEELTVLENLVVYGRFFGLRRREALERAEELLQFADLSDRARANIRSLSGGMMRRLTIARSLINRPDIVLLDEPTIGLDPEARHTIWDHLRALKASGTTLVLTTHYMDEAATLCDRLVIMDKGRILRAGSPRDLVNKEVARHVVEVIGHAGPIGSSVANGRLVGLVENKKVLSDRVLFYTNDSRGLTDQLVSGGVSEEAIVTRPASLEDVFLKTTGHLEDVDERIS